MGIQSRSAVGVARLWFNLSECTHIQTDIIHIWSIESFYSAVHP